MAKSQDWHALRHQAETVPCPHCHAPAGHTCRNHIADRELQGPPAHHQRLAAAQNPTTQTPTTENTP